MKRLLLPGRDAIARLITQAPLLSWIPYFSKENETAQNLIITLDAKENTSLTTDIYISTGVITNLGSHSMYRKHVAGTYLGRCCSLFSKEIFSLKC